VPGSGSPAVPPSVPQPATLWSVRNSRAFTEARVGSRNCRHDRLVIQHAPGDTANPVMLGLIVGRPVGNAVRRNRVRRRLKSVVRELAPQLTGSTLVIRALPGSYEQTFAELRQSVVRCVVVS
jgi:ribonuclease P protein component